VKPTLYTYFRSSCSFRVRIALALKGIDYESCFINLHPDVSAQLADDYREINPQKKVPYFADENIQLAQSIAILEYLDEIFPEPALLPSNVIERAKVRQLVQLIACDIQPLNNVSILGYLKDSLNANQDQVTAWYHHWIHSGFSALESMLEESEAKQFCFAETLSMADVVLIPQVWNAHRFDVPLESYPTILGIYEQCMSLSEFQAAAPENQADAPQK